MVEPFVGATVNISGDLRDMFDEGDYLLVMLEGPIVGPITVLSFSPEYRQALRRFTGDDRIDARCSLRSLDSTRLSFGDCELLPSSYPPAS